MTTSNNAAYTAAQFQETLNKGSKAAQESFDQMSKMTQEYMKKSYPTMVAGCDEATTQSKQNMDALSKSAALYAKGWEQISQACWSWSQEAMQDCMSASKAIMGCKNVKEFMDLQSDVTKSTMDRWMSEGGKITEMSVKVANEASQPIQKRADQAMQTMAKKASAA